MVYFLAQLHNHWREIKGPTRTMDTSNAQEIDMVLPLNQQTTTVEDGIVYHYLPVQSMRWMRSGMAYALAWNEPLVTNHVHGHLVSVQGLDTSLVYKLSTGLSMANGP